MCQFCKRSQSKIVTVLFKQILIIIMCPKPNEIDTVQILLKVSLGLDSTDNTMGSFIKTSLNIKLLAAKFSTKYYIE